MTVVSAVPRSTECFTMISPQRFVNGGPPAADSTVCLSGQCAKWRWSKSERLCRERGAQTPVLERNRADCGRDASRHAGHCSHTERVRGRRNRADCGTRTPRRIASRTEPTRGLEPLTARLQVGCATSCAKSAWPLRADGLNARHQPTAATAWGWESVTGSGWSRTHRPLPAARTAETLPPRTGSDTRTVAR